jgi:hypothetical protein
LPILAFEETRYFVGVCSGVFGSTSYRTQFELVNENPSTINGQISFYSAEGELSAPELRSIWSGDAGRIEKSEAGIEFSIPGKSTLVILTIPHEGGGLGWAKLETDQAIHAQAALQTAHSDTAVNGDFNSAIQYQAELHSVEAMKEASFPISLYAGMKHLSTAFTVVNLSGSRAKVTFTFRPDVVREVELGPGELLADYFERFWPLAFPAIYPLQLRGTAEVTSEAPLGVGVFRTINGFPDLGIRVASPPPEVVEPSDVDLGAEFDIRVGQTVQLSDTDLRIQLWDVSEDSRCPVDAVCVWEGVAIVDLHISRAAGESPESFLLSTGSEQGLKYAGYEIRLVDVEPGPVSTEQIEISQYRVRLLITRTDSD